MSAPDYLAIEDALKAIFDATPAIAGGAVTMVETRGDNNLTSKAYIGIFLDRVVPQSSQPFAAGKVTYEDLIFKIVLAVQGGTVRKAAEGRNTLLKLIKETLQDNRTITNNVSCGYFGPCEMGIDDSKGHAAIAIQEFTAFARLTT